MRLTPRFRYFTDPICLGSIVIYLIGRFFLRPHHIGGEFVHDYLNDVLCLPLFLPMILGVQRLVRLRDHDGPPRMWELLQHWVIFSVVFEIVLPQYPKYFRTTADPMDVVAYLAGGLATWGFWQMRRVAASEADNAAAKPGVERNATPDLLLIERNGQLLDFGSKIPETIYTPNVSFSVPVTIFPQGTNPAFCSVSCDAVLSTLQRAAGMLPCS